MLVPDIPVLPQVEFAVPRTLERLVELAYNLWWSWNPQGRNLWTALDPVRWEQVHNPVDLLSSIDRPHWAAIEQGELVHERYRQAVRAFDAYRARRDTWFDRHDGDLTGPIAYLCTEYGLHSSLPLYSGGLGILAGDHTKAASDLGIPLVAVGLLYRRGYFRQEIDADGDQQHFYRNLDPRRLPVRPVAAPTGGQLKVGVEFPGRTVWAAVWKLDVGNVPLLLLDTDIPDNEAFDRPITHTLYVRGREMRFCQELVLGVGGVRALAALGIEPGAFHVNEGHAALSLVERLAQAVEGGADLEVAARQLRAHTLFTLHTPVPAGNEVFDSELAVRYLGPWAGRIGVDLGRLVGLAAPHDGDPGPFDLGALAIRFSSIVNGVSRRHGEIVARDWQHLIGGTVTHVTNGVHTPTWVGRAGGRILVREFGPDWPTRLVEDENLARRAEDLPADVIWSAHQSRKEIFVRFARGRIRRQLARHGASPDRLRRVEEALPPERLTIGFARRFAAYKRATLMFTDPERLHALLTNPERPIQVVFAGKAHPADDHGQALIRQIVEWSRAPEFAGHIYVLENYDARMARFMTQGCDVWLNNPRPPMEASGTSGMKAAINGTLNLSILDGWWLEGYTTKNGWAFGSPDPNDDHGAVDYHDALSLYEVLEHEVAPLFYERDDAGLPQGWIQVMRESIASSIARFSAHRMVRDYFELAYRPLASTTS